MKLAGDVFDEYLDALGPWTRDKWTACFQRWAKNKLLPIDKKYLQEAVDIEFKPYYDDSDPYKLAFRYFQSWVKSLNEKIAFLQGNRPWCPALESAGGCFAKKERRYGDDVLPHNACFGLFVPMEDSVTIMRKDGESEVFRDVYEMVLTGQWIAD